jgi:type II secretory pathway component PulK
MKKRHSGNRAIALMIVLSSVIILTFGIRELIMKTGAQVDRVRNTYDRIQALYLAKSTQNLARFFIILDGVVSEDIDGPDSLWNQPIPFPLPVEVLNPLSENADLEVERSDLNRDERSLVDRCQDFYQSFQGNAYAQVEDGSSRLNLNDLNREDVQQVLLRLMTRDFQMVESLRDRQINPEEVIQEAVEYISREVDFFLPRNPDYRYEPKRREFSVTEEIKMLPSVDDELFQSIKNDITAVSFPRRPRPSKINVNTMSRELFQSLLQGVGSPENVAENFENLRKGNLSSGGSQPARTFSEAQLDELVSELSLDRGNLPTEILTGRSSFFRISTFASVGETKIELESFLKAPDNSQETQPYIRTRISP